jgi:hypothetical protein
LLITPVIELALCNLLRGTLTGMIDDAAGPNNDMHVPVMMPFKKTNQISSWLVCARTEMVIIALPWRINCLRSMP